MHGLRSMRCTCAQLRKEIISVTGRARLTASDCEQRPDLLAILPALHTLELDVTEPDMHLSSHSQALVMYAMSRMPQMRQIRTLRLLPPHVGMDVSCEQDFVAFGNAVSNALVVRQTAVCL